MAIVIFLCFGLSIYGSIQTFFKISSSQSSRSWLYRLTDISLYSITIYEVIILAAVIPFLFVRNWRLKDFNLQFSLRLVGVALLLVIARNIIGSLLYKAFSVIYVATPALEKIVTFKLDVSIYGLIPILVVNSLFEELIVVGYIFKRLENMSAVVVVSVSILIRLLYHLYQGPIAFFVIIPTGLVFALYYWKYKRLTPLIIAHSLSNLFAYLWYIHDFKPGST